MSKIHTLRALMTARLAAATEEILSLFERTIEEYEEELRLSKEETHRTQAVLKSLLYPRVRLLQAAAEASPEPGPNHGPNPEIPKPSLIKEEPEEQAVEQAAKQEQDQLPEPVPELTVRKRKRRRYKLSQKLRTSGDTENSSDTDPEDDTSKAPLDSLLYPTVRLLQAAAETSPEPDLNHGPNLEIPEPSQIKEDPEEQAVKQEQDQLPEPVPELTVKKRKRRRYKLSRKLRTSGDTENSSDTDPEDDTSKAPLDSLLYPRVRLLRADAEASPEPGLNHGPNPEIPEPSRIREEPEEQAVTPEQDQLPEPVPELTVKKRKRRRYKLSRKLRTSGDTENSSDTDPEDNTSKSGPSVGCGHQQETKERYSQPQTEGATEDSSDTDYEVTTTRDRPRHTTAPNSHLCRPITSLSLRSVPL